MYQLRLMMFNRRAAAAQSKSDEIIRTLNLRQGDVIADIGSGGGFFTIRFAQQVGEQGQVYALDTEENNLNYVKKMAEKAGLKNITMLLSPPGKANLPPHQLDLIFLRNVFHHLPQPEEYFRHLREPLKPSGKIAIVEHKERRKSFFQSGPHHFTPESVIIETMKKAGFKQIQNFSWLDEQSFNVFQSDPDKR